MILRYSWVWCCAAVGVNLLFSAFSGVWFIRNSRSCQRKGMHVLALSLLLVVTAFAGVNVPDEWTNAYDVNTWRANNEVIIIGFATRNCEDCFYFGQTIPKIRTALVDEGVVARVHMMDIEDHINKDFVVRYDTFSLPAIYIFIGKESSTFYAHGPYANLLARFTKRLINFEPRVLTNIDEALDFSTTNPALLVVVDDIRDSYAIVNEAAKEDPDRVAYISADLVAELGLDPNKTLHMCRKDGRSSNVEIPDTLEQLRTWIKIAKAPAIVSFIDERYDIYHNGVNTILFYIDNKVIVRRQQWMEDLANRLRGNILFVGIDTMESDPIGRVRSEAALQRIGFDRSKHSVPAMWLYNIDDDNFFPYEEKDPINVDTMTEWIKLYLLNALVPQKKSLPLPEDWDANPVKILVGTNFEEVALDKITNVFVLFDAPNCKKCDKLLKIFEIVAETYEQDEETSHRRQKSNIIFAKIDGYRNRGWSQHIDNRNAYPALVMFGVGGTIKEYKGRADLETLQQFITDQTRINPSKGPRDEL